MDFEIKAHLASIPGAVRYAFRDLDVETARDFAVCVGIVGSAVAVAFSMAGVGLATQQACAPEVIRPVAQDTWFVPPTVLSEPQAVEPAETEQKAGVKAYEDEPRRKSSRRR